MRIGPAVVLAVMGTLAACGGQKRPDTSQAANAPPEVEVYLVPAGQAPAGQVYAVPSTLAVEHEADLLAEEAGRLVEVLADQGKRVKRGEVLARLDDARLRKQLDQDRAEMQMLQVQAREAEVLREGAEVELQRQTELRKEGLGSLRDFDRARFNLEVMRQEVEKARFEFEKAKAKVEADELRLSRMELKAPFNGIVARRYARVGQMLLENEKVLRVTELHPLLVRFTVPEALREAVGKGAEVRVIPAEQAAVVRARILRTSYVVDAASGSLDCTAQLLEPVPATLVPGMAVEVKIPGPAGQFAARALWIPPSAVRREPDGSGAVFAVKANQLERRTIKLGRETSTAVEVLSGISAGDRIVAQVSEKLQDGMSVRVRP